MTELTEFTELDNLTWLQDWYSRHCNGEWEHSWGIKISTLDNPGWMVTINLRNTELFEKAFEKINVERSENDWVQCFIDDFQFKMACGPKNLDEALQSFRAFASS